MVTKDHLKAVLRGDKQFFKMNNVKFCNPPAYDEKGVKALYQKVVSQPELQPYFPDSFPIGQRCCKSYMFNVWNTVKPDQVE